MLWAGVVDAYGPGVGTLLYSLYCLTQKSITSLGNLWGRWSTRNSPVIPPMTSVIQINDRIISGGTCE